jgi:hypothetical protein
VNYLFRVVSKLSKSERSFIKDLGASKTNSGIPRILRVLPPASEEIEFFDFYSMIYMLEFSDMIKVTMSSPVKQEGSWDESQNSGTRIKWAEFFLRGVPLDYQSGRLQVELDGDLDDILGYFKRHDKFIRPQALSLSNGRVNFSQKNRALTFLYGCDSVKLRNVKLNLTDSTERLNEI